MIKDHKYFKYIPQVLCVYIALLIMGASGYQFQPGLKINAPVISPTNPELR